MGHYIEDPADDFDYEADWKEAAQDAAPSSFSFTNEVQESTRVGYIRGNKARSAVKHFLGYSVADTTSPWRLRRVQPQWDAEHPYLFAHSITFAPTVVESNPDNTNRAPFNTSPFAVDANWFTRYKWLAATVKYRSYKNCRFLPDSAIATARDEYKRNCTFTTAAKLDVLQADGTSQLKFAETSATGPAVGTAFPAPINVLLPKASFIVEWLNVDRAYLTTNPYVFFPRKILACVGKVNSTEFLGMPAGTLLMQPPEFVENPWPFPSDTAADEVYDILTNVTVRMQFDYFEPMQGATAPLSAGHNTFPWRADGKFYLATRDGSVNLSKAFLEYAEFGTIFEHVSAP